MLLLSQLGSIKPFHIGILLVELRKNMAYFVQNKSLCPGLDYVRS